LTVGKTVYGLGILPKSAGYKAYLNEAIVSANLRGEVPQVLVSGSLGNVGSPVFDDQFRAVGVVIPQQGQEMLLNDERAGLEGLLIPARFFERSSFFIDSIQNPPAADQPIHIPWIGVPGMTGVDEQFSKFLGLKDKPAVQLGDVVPDSPAAKAGLQPGNIIIAMNGKPLERGDLPEELPMIMRRNIMRKNVGDKLTFTVMTDKDTPPHDVTVTLEQRPRTPNQAKRYYAEDLGFVAREAVFTDAYEHKMNPSEPGVVIDTLRRDGAAATAKLAREDWVMQLNGEAVSTLDHFKEDYQTFRKGHPKDDVVLVVHTAAGQEETVNIEPPQTDVAPGGEGAQ
jgi:S1-C subfamily serine protease